MNYFLYIFSIWILMVNPVQPLSIPGLSDVMDMVTLVTDISDIVTGRHDLTSGNLFKKKVDPTLAKVNELSAQINELTTTLNVKVDRLMTAVLEDVPRAVQYASLMRKLIGYVSRIDELFDDYQYYVQKFGNVTQYTMEDFSKVTTSHKYGDVQDVLRQMYHLFIPGQLDQKDESLLDLMTATLKAAEPAERCNQLKTSQQQLYELYETVIITEMKGFTMASYAYGLLSIYHNKSFVNEVERVTSQTILRCSQYLISVTDYLEGLPREIYMCDPQEHLKGETYIELNALRRVVVHNSQTSKSKNCDVDCEDLYGDKYYRNYSSDGKNWMPVQPCNGYFSNCLDIGEATFCEQFKFVDQRFSWVDNKLGVFGNKDDCYNGKIHTLRKYYKNDNLCSTCFCDCSETHKESTAIRTISLRPQMADIDNNMIVTGVRFQVKDLMIHVQIEQGKLSAGGQIQEYSNNWKKLEDFKYLDNVEGGGFLKIDSNETMKEGVDYQFIYNGQRDVNLDDVYSLESGWVVTGLKMSRDPDNSKAIQLEVHLTPFNYSTGILEPTDENPSKWINHKDMPGHWKPYTKRTQIDLETNWHGSKYNDNHPNSEDFSNVWFVVSATRTELGKYTLPSFDSQSVLPNPRVALDGVSLFYRGREDSGGFLGFKLNTVNIPDYLNTELSPEVLELFNNDVEINIITNPVEM